MWLVAEARKDGRKIVEVRECVDEKGKGRTNEEDIGEEGRGGL